jgi:hypothetical protein
VVFGPELSTWFPVGLCPISKNFLAH